MLAGTLNYIRLCSLGTDICAEFLLRLAATLNLLPVTPEFLTVICVEVRMLRTAFYDSL